MLELQVIGEFSEQPGHFLLLGGDGGFYEYDSATACMRRLEDNEAWRVDVIENASIVVEATSTVFATPRRRNTRP